MSRKVNPSKCQPAISRNDHESSSESNEEEEEEEEEDDDEEEEGEEEKLEGLRDFAERQKQMEKRKEAGPGERRNAVEKRKSETRSGRSGLEESSFCLTSCTIWRGPASDTK